MTEYLKDSFDWNSPDLVASYDELPLWSAAFGLLLLKHIPLSKGMRVLDIGCGTGFPVLELAQRLGSSCLAIGIDPWQTALHRARKKAAELKIQNASLVAGDGALLPFPADRFNLVVSNLGFNNFPFPDRVLVEIWRVLRTGGRIALTTNLRGHMRELYGVFASVLKEFGNPAWLDSLREHIEHRATVEAVRRLLVESGFAVGRVYYEEFFLRFTDGSALLRHAFIKAGFLSAWREIVGKQAENEVFVRLENRLNAYCAQYGELSLTIPMAYMEGEKELN